MNWISPRDFSKVYADFRSRTVQGTGQWFLELEQFTLWKEKRTQYLWVSGKGMSIDTTSDTNGPRYTLDGAGKSFLSSTGIAEIGNRADCQVTYLYLLYKTLRSRTCSGMLQLNSLAS
ncbi:hypothetical protein IWX90DRAFT_443593 [Phyllosticta citrichinensis]|uniref:Uncharacterized protein n=1 Tax=Phyllosticta citrichinensis TaxID=1130410 RepID=A0ABR1XH22_9PEZI